jgi:hypothetical protein
MPDPTEGRHDHQAALHAELGHPFIETESRVRRTMMEDDGHA